jgi:AcrR family transcriptional regulator
MDEQDIARPGPGAAPGADRAVAERPRRGRAGASSRSNQAVLRRDEYLRVAARLMAEHGFDRTSTRDIAQAIGLSSGNIFHHFGSKENLLAEIIRHGVVSGVAMMRQAIAPCGNALQKLFHGIRVHLDIMHGQLGDFHRVWQQEWSRLLPADRAALSAFNRGSRDIWDGILHALAEEGLLRSDPTLARHVLLPALNWSVVWLDYATANLDEVAVGISAVMFNIGADEMRRRFEAAGVVTAPRVTAAAGAEA